MAFLVLEQVERTRKIDEFKKEYGVWGKKILGLSPLQFSYS